MGSHSSNNIGSVSDYLAAKIPGGGGPQSDVGGLGSLLGTLSGSSILGPLAGAVGAIPALIGAFSGRASTGPGSATNDIASGGSASSDPILRLLGEGASGLANSNIPISSGAASSFGPYFDAARRAEDFVRWGQGADPKAQALDATTLKTALTELGNPGKDGSSTVQGLNDAWNKFTEKNPPGSAGYNQFLQIANQMSPTESAIFKSMFGSASAPGIGGSAGGATALGALAPLLLAGGSVNKPIDPIRLPDVNSPKQPQAATQRGNTSNPQSQLLALLQILARQNGQS